MNTKTPLDYFKEISAIPRASGNEAGMAAYLMAFGKAMGLSSYTDAHHNVFLKKEASRGRESEPPVLLQAHTDMVAEKNAGVKHDFATEGIELVFEGIDTYADIYLNGKLLGSCDNMFVCWRFDVTGMLVPGNNDLMAVFPVMSQKAAEKRLPEGFWTNYSTERAYARKAAYSFGWDWAPRIASAGLFRPVHLDSYQTGRLREVRIDAADIRI